MLNKIISKFILLQFIICCLISCSNGDTTFSKPDNDIIILYDNDVHCAVNGYPKFAALRNEMLTTTPFVTTVSCGDFLQGESIGAYTQGKAIANIMNSVGYDLVTLGNHEFDYGVEQLFSITNMLNATTLNCNFRDLRTGNLVYSPYKILKYGKAQIAFIGVTTPAAMSISLTKFQDSTGTKIYDFMTDEVFAQVQKYVAEVKNKGADYVIVLSHLGDIPAQAVNSVSLIENTTGIDVVLDGHSHSTITDSTLYNLNGKPVLLTSTGTKFQNFGVLTLNTKGQFSSQLIASGTYAKENADIRKIVSEEEFKLDELFKQNVGYSDFDFNIFDANGKRVSRNQECTIGNLCADAFRSIAQTDIAILNSGSLRASLPKGDISLLSLYNVIPYSNQLCIGTITGAQLLDALEYGVRLIPYEIGCFPQVSGMKYDIDASVNANIKLDDDELFERIDGNMRRISNLLILNRSNGKYEPVDTSRIYTITATDYLIRDKGDGGILRYAICLEETGMTDLECVSQFIRTLPNATILSSYSHTEGRINIK